MAAIESTDASTAAASAAPTEGVSLEVARRNYRRLRGLVIAAVVVACAAPLSLNVVDPDLWGHVRYGQDWIADAVASRSAESKETTANAFHDG